MGGLVMRVRKRPKIGKPTTLIGKRLAQGAIAHTGEPSIANEHTDKAVAVTYQHPALGDRPVVRITSESMRDAEALELEAVGLSSIDANDVGHIAQQALGFPGWALVHDPKRAKHALAVVKRLRLAMHRARVKPGLAKEGIDALAGELGRTVPHFLPSFYEQVARNFADAGVRQYASQYFGKAREAERVHALDVDEDDRRQAFIEFSLMGCVSGKALNQYASELAKAHSPQESYDYFFGLAVQRTLGGAPPWAAMAKDLRSLAKAAGLDVATEAVRVIEAILLSPAIAKASKSFWKDYRDAIVSVARRSERHRQHLFSLFAEPPTGYNAASDFTGFWYDLLADANVLDLADDLDPKQATDWMNRWIGHSAPGWYADKATMPKEIFTLMRQLAPRLADSPVVFACFERPDAIDLADEALSLGIAIGAPNHHFKLDVWAANAHEPDHGRALDHIAQDAQLREHLDQAVGEASGSEPFESLASKRPALIAARTRWLYALIERASAYALPSCDDALKEISEDTSATTFAQCDGSYAALEQLDVAACLMRTLHNGIVDEIGWPALEQAVAELGSEIEFYGNFPYLIPCDGKRAIVIGPEGREASYDLKLPKDAEVAQLRYVQNCLRVGYLQDYTAKAYWSHEPREHFDDAHYRPYKTLGATLDDGALWDGSKPLRAGDRSSYSSTDDVIGDGTTWWRYNDSWPRKLWEADPQTGKHIRKSQPAFYDRPHRPGQTLNLEMSRLYPMGPGLLPTKDGLYGIRTLERCHDHPEASLVPVCEVETLTGFKVELPQEVAVVADIKFPGATQPTLIVENDDPWRNHANFELADLHGRRTWIGYGRTPPALWLHFCAFADPDSSRALRSLRRDDVAMLMQTAQGADTNQATPQLTAALSDLGICNKGVQQGVIGLLDKANKLAAKAQKLVQARSPAAASRDSNRVSINEILRVVRGPLLRRWGEPDGSMTRPIFAASDFLRDDDTRDLLEALPSCEISWLELVEYPMALVPLAAPSWLSEANKAGLRRLRLAIVDTIFADPDVDFVSFEYNDDDDRLGKMLEDAHIFSDGVLLRRDGCAVVFIEERGLAIKDNASPGVGLPDGWVANNVRDWRPQAQPVNLDTLEAPPDFPTQADGEALSAAVGISVSAALVAMAGFADTHDTEKTIREALGLKAQQFTAAKNELDTVSASERFALLAEVGRVWAAGENLTQAWCQAWRKLRGVSKVIPEALTIATRHLADDSVQALRALANPESANTLNQVPVWAFSDDGDYERDHKVEAIALEKIDELREVVAFVANYIPVGEPLRGDIPQLINHMRKAIDNDELQDHFFSAWFTTSKKLDAAWDQIMAIPGKTVSSVEHKRMQDMAKVGYQTAFFLCVKNPNYQSVSIYGKPALLTQPNAQRQLQTLADLYNDGLSADAEIVASVRGDDFGAFADRVQDTPVPSGSYESNPWLSVPDIIASAENKLGISREAAMLYLQTLALANPKQKDVVVWNGWTTKIYKQAGQELVDKALLVTAKRTRAGRPFFLPGGWEEWKAPRQPMESWKLTLYNIWRYDSPGEHNNELVHRAGGFVGPAPIQLPPGPAHLYFARAWQRIEDGDIPKYEDLA